MEEKFKIFQLKLPEELHRKFKIYSIKISKNMTNILIQKIKEIVKNE